MFALPKSSQVFYQFLPSSFRCCLLLFPITSTCRSSQEDGPQATRMALILSSSLCDCVKSPQLSQTLQPCGLCPPGSSVHGILQATILEWVDMHSSRASSRPRDRTHVSYVSHTGRRVLDHSTTRRLSGL